MRLFDAILDANHRAVAGDSSAAVRPGDFAEELPVIALTCVDPRLNTFFPNILGLPPDKFIWLRNAGNIITGPLSSTMRSLALACAVKGGREIVVIGHTDCHVCKTTTMQLLDRFKALGIARQALPDNISEFFGTFGSEQQNIIKACGFARQSPIIGAKVPVHGFLVDINTARLEWVVNGYQELESFAAARSRPAVTAVEEGLSPLPGSTGMSIGWGAAPAAKIGEQSPALRLTPMAEVAPSTARLEGQQRPSPVSPPIPPPLYRPQPNIPKKKGR